jgi:Cu+-exporting ATPase
MMCPKCVAHVKSALEKVEGVTSVTVSLEKKNAVVTGTADAEALKNAVIEEGYEVLSVE